MAAKNNNLVNNPVDFTVPWKLSDIVLVVEDQKFHAHRGTLAYWSPVFENMFTSEFKEKYSSEIHLPGKKASEIKELLHIMYPSMEEKPVTKNNCYFLFELAHEYQIESIAHKCERVMAFMVKARTEDDVLSMLVYGQKYQLKSLISTCIYEARRLTLKELRKHKSRDEIEPDNYVRIAEGIIQRLEATVETQCKVNKQIKEGCLNRLKQASCSLFGHALAKGKIASVASWEANTDTYLYRVKADTSEKKCASLKPVATELMALKNTLLDL